MIIYFITGCNNIDNKIHKLSNATVYKGHYKTGKPYVIKNKKYYPREYRRYTEVGLASWYGEKDGFHGKKTANGDIFNKNLLTAAHKTLPLPSMVKVTNLHNNKSLIVMVNDRGPFCHNRIIDLSATAAERLGFKKQGVTKVKIIYLPLETKNLLAKLRLQKKEGAIAKNEILQPYCTLNCYMKKINNKHLGL